MPLVPVTDAVREEEGLAPEDVFAASGFATVDADVTDARFLDPPSTWNVLYAKGPAAWDVSGFVVRVDRDGLPYFLDAGGTGLVRGSLARIGRRAPRYQRLPAPRYYRTRR